MKSRSYQVFGNMVDRIDTDEKVVALTFDDGPNQKVPELLALLDEYSVPATFFLVGRDIETHPEEMRMIINSSEITPIPIQE
ncbi:polysaccharide deacetylase family protein [Salicibibacter cibi]|uniref:Polysaccharide deacetylase family protein n=1 Tax=Salicibibacter cibi TaxID=2743001 RepID=A0A7T7CGR8_9BACI|nr:polysaccharide deacetylase family protein [Salicibibacter cibi]QQK81470.1 polysaccharide deacetylase family protein [Salicibibacter cibi]